MAGILVLVGLYFTFRMKFTTLTMIPEMFKLIGEKTVDGKGVSSFQAFCISAAARVGTGNMAGVAIAISVGGPGAVFWMWLIAFLGAASGFVEATLAQIYKTRDGASFRGGPAYYMEKALKARWMGVTFAVIIALTFGLAFNTVQANTIVSAFHNSFGVSKELMAVLLTIGSAIIIFGGTKLIVKVSEVIVPIMAGGYILLALGIIIFNITEIPHAFVIIFQDAFGIKEISGGAFGIAIIQGIKRGLFSNEAGMGSAPHAAATANVSHPVKQGLIQTLGVYVDTFGVCTSTAFIVLLSGLYTSTENDGIVLTQNALESLVGSWAGIFIALMVLLFAFTSIVGNYFYGESNINFIKKSKTWVFIYRLAVVAVVAVGSLAGLDLVWGIADIFMAIMAFINLIAIVLLGNIAFRALHDYRQQKRAGKNPHFSANSVPGIHNVDEDIWPTEESRNSKVSSH
ncbi:sodium:alanine symporter family protein [Terribacillus saccharophilus]|uniref:alanine/glycine:cation symporter family protein n=1 Tax=Terribacillus saccharophilus TaxID=361277 RepID=UPI000BA7AE9A|nr:alanine/glycine:cation symporter family protein [Terribacillus saccharophilus]PAF17136.1 sodium:alanine symporter family protein [Terribacillus saccharophilus]PAF36093.1 sodium:alanine symporter family protein [Terribacillus saccharophilus]